MKTSFYSSEELRHLGFKQLGRNVRISAKASLYSPERMEIGDNVRIDDFCILSGSLRLGNYIHIGAYSALFGAEPITLENYTGLSSRVSIYTVSEDYLGEGMTNPTIPDEFRHPTVGPVRLCEHVIIGAGSVILPGVTIGEGTAVGALSMVMGSLQAWKVARGVPAKPIMDRRQDLIKKYQRDLETRLKAPEAAGTVAPTSL
jgi:acetyltransferase-like isoleucine patch superfamily enzyme